ncbi:MAG: hypothetical protein ACP5QT_02855 [Brevinematia bacterium]
MLKRIIFFIFTFTSGYAASLDKNYTLIYFKFYPTDLKIRIYTDNKLSSTLAEKMDYFIPHINNKTGEAKIFLVNSSQLERLESILTYQYKVVFYKVQNIENQEFEVQVYSFKLSFQSNKIIVKYDNLNEKVFLKDLISDTYILKDEKGDDFILTEKIRPVKFAGKLKKITADKKTNYIDISSDVKLTLMKKDDDKTTFNIDNKFEVPLNKEFFIGHYPYEIIASENEKYKPVGILLKNNEESKNLIIHFGEVWDYPYQYNLVLERNPDVLEIDFDEDIYELEYKIGKKEFKKADKKLWLNINKIVPISISNVELKEMSFQTNTSNNTVSNIITNFVFKTYTQITNFTTETISLKISGLTKALKWLKNPVHNISFSVTSGDKASKVTEEILSSNKENFKIGDDKESLIFITEFKTTPFSIFAHPENAEVEIKRIEPLSKNESDTLIFNTTPVFLSEFPYGRYIIYTRWFNEEKTIEYETSNYIVINENSLKKQSYGIKFLTNKSVRIPYIDIYQPEQMKKENLYLKKIDLPEKKVKTTFEKKSINTPNYFIQLIAFEINYPKLKKEMKNFITFYENKYHKMHGEKINLFTAEKKIKGKNYIVLVSGPYANNDAKFELSKSLKILRNSFIVRKDELDNILPATF